MSRPRLAILISGRGSNMQVFIDACASGRLDARIARVISNRPGAPGLARAARAGVPTDTLDHRAYASREAFDQALARQVMAAGADLVLLAGFMRILTPTFIEPFAGRLFNIHPSLLPRHPGLDTHQRALDAGDRETGATVHFVTAELDGGPPILQARVPIQPQDTAASLAERVLPLEHAIYPLAVRWYLAGRLKLRGQRAFLDGAPLPPNGRQLHRDAGWT